MRDLIAEAASIFAATGNELAIRVAGLLRSLPAAQLPSTRTEARQIPGLDSALTAMSPSALGHLLDGNLAHLPWTIIDDQVPKSFAGRSASAEIAGPDGVVQTDALRFGLFWQSAETFYPSHSHAAEELYFLLSGNPRWQKDDASFVTLTPGSLVHHATYQRHAMKSDREGFLAMWTWTGDLSFSSYQFHETE